MSNITYDGIYAPKGGSYRHPLPLPPKDPPQQYDAKGKKKKRKLPRGQYSYYTLPILHTPGRAAGNSRIHGDASHETQKKSIDAIIEAAKKHGLSQRETAHVLAIARVESGFNPDAAAGTTTASSLGQFIRGTGWGYGLNDSNRFELKSNADALVRHYIANRDIAKSRGFSGKELELKIYQYHHDGPGSKKVKAKDYGGLGISKKQVIPLTNKYEKLLNGEKFAPIAAKPVNKPLKSSITVAHRPAAPITPRWSNPSQNLPSSVRNPTPLPNYHNARNAAAMQSKAGKPPTSNQPKASLLDRIDHWLFDTLCFNDVDE